jgi:UDP-GlcNAc:undecaprenyl-phosphate/decaprenyl-phosphate GlcNAc-1-phosphate transferase
VTLALVGLALVVGSFVLSALFSALARVVAPRFGLVDKPGGRKAHRAPTPLGGGVAIWLTVVLMVALGALALGPGKAYLPAAVAIHAGGAWERVGELTLILGMSTIIMAMGLVDDRVGLGWKLRLGVQVGLSAIVVASGVHLTLFKPFDSLIVSGAITVLWIVGLTNSFNFLDNMDGLAAGVGLIAASLFVAAQVEVEGRFVPAVLLVLVGALGGFLVHNTHPARLFMGDAGSNFIGFLLGTLTVVGTFTRPAQGYSPYGVLTPLLVMAVPLYDTTSVILIRIREGRSPFEADRRHFSHRLVDRGLTPPLAVRTIYLVTLAGGLGALLLPRPWMNASGACVVVAQTICLLGVVALLEVSTNRPERRDDEAKHPN